MLSDITTAAQNEDKRLVEDVIKKAEDTRSLYERITEYLSELFASGGLTEDQANQTAGIMYILSDVDRMGALCKDIGNALQDKQEKKYKYSKDAMRDLEKAWN